MRAIDVCAGAGGLSLGLQLAGFDVLGVERDGPAVEVHRRHVGPCELADVETWHPSEPADLVAGGPPCQPYSDQGKRLGLYDPRGSLFRHLVRIAVEAEARAVLLENVPGLVSWQDGRALREILDCMREAGFTRTAHTVLTASHYGVAQRRHRLFVVGLRAGLGPIRWPVATTAGDLWSARGEPTVREALGLSGAFRAGRDEGARGWSSMRSLDVDAPSPVVLGSRNAEKLSLLDRPAPTITTVHYVTRDPHRRSRRPCAELAHEIDLVGHREPLQCGSARLSTEQRALLQGFPPGWTWPAKATDSSRVIGNAVPPALAHAVGLSVRRALEAGVS